MGFQIPFDIATLKICLTIISQHSVWALTSNLKFISQNVPVQV